MQKGTTAPKLFNSSNTAYPQDTIHLHFRWSTTILTPEFCSVCVCSVSTLPTLGELGGFQIAKHYTNKSKGSKTNQSQNYSFISQIPDLKYRLEFSTEINIKILTMRNIIIPEFGFHRTVLLPCCKTGWLQDQGPSQQLSVLFFPLLCRKHPLQSYILQEAEKKPWTGESNSNFTHGKSSH